jgi:hypothetical protein
MHFKFSLHIFPLLLQFPLHAARRENGAKTIYTPLACFAVKYNRKENTKYFARPTGIIRAGKDHKEIQWAYSMFCRLDCLTNLKYIQNLAEHIRYSIATQPL